MDHATFYLILIQILAGAMTTTLVSVGAAPAFHAAQARSIATTLSAVLYASLALGAEVADADDPEAPRAPTLERFTGRPYVWHAAGYVAVVAETVCLMLTWLTIGGVHLARPIVLASADTAVACIAVVGAVVRINGQRIHEEQLAWEPIRKMCAELQPLLTADAPPAGGHLAVVRDQLPVQRGSRRATS